MIAVSWDVTPCSLVEVYGPIRGTYCLHLQGQRVRQASNKHAGRTVDYLTYILTLKKEAIFSFDTSVKFHQTKRRHMPEDNAHLFVSPFATLNSVIHLEAVHCYAVDQYVSFSYVCLSFLHHRSVLNILNHSYPIYVSWRLELKISFFSYVSCIVRNCMSVPWRWQTGYILISLKSKRLCNFRLEEHRMVGCCLQASRRKFHVCTLSMSRSEAAWEVNIKRTDGWIIMSPFSPSSCNALSLIDWV
jgi:hypothetical protein